MIIYKITNSINNKVYIGQTIRALNKRWWEHKKDSETSELPLYRAMRKYGLENFTIEEIGGANSQSELNYVELHHIYLLNSIYPNGYNLRIGGSQGTHSQETRNKISNIIREMDRLGTRPILKGKDNPAYGNAYRKGVKLSQETKDKISKGHLGTTKSQKTKNKMSSIHTKRMESQELRDRISKTLRKTSTLKKPIKRSDGVVFESLHDCARQMNTRAPDICTVLKGRRKTHRGYSFEYIGVDK